MIPATRQAPQHTLGTYLLLGCSVLVLLSVLFCVGVGWLMRDWEPFTSNRVDRASIEANADLRLPSSAYDLYVHQEGLNEIFILVRFSMPAADLPSFIQSTTCQDELAPVEPTMLTIGANAPSWWKPNTATSLLGCTGATADSSQRILVDTSDAAIYVVYVSAGDK